VNKFLAGAGIAYTVEYIPHHLTEVYRTRTLLTTQRRHIGLANSQHRTLHHTSDHSNEHTWRKRTRISTEKYEFVHVTAWKNGTQELLFLEYAAAIVTCSMQRQIIILPCSLHIQGQGLNGALQGP
jgi:hypothetical protein